MKKKAFDVEPAKFEDDPGYKDVKPADQSADNDIDRIAPDNEPGKKETDEAYFKKRNSSEAFPDPAKK